MHIWAGLVIGLAGSFHCIGMCGPIVLAMSSKNESPLKFLTNRVIYNSGRIISYSILGIVSGLLGAGVRMAGMQRWLSIVLGVVIILAVLLPTKYVSRLFPGNLWDRFSIKMKSLWGRLLGKRSSSSMLLIGFLNGFLPCGLVYIAMASAAAAPTMFESIMTMVLFGLGTFPVMLATAYLGNFISLKIRNTIQKLIPAGAILLATLLIVRGLSLGIPYVSPKFSVDSHDGKETVNVDCCH
ncbi:MAG: sulfite exporter TauE/SafE family protein [Candidatus Electryonea clarkiae]|nr:sulfite exporter TauE/SafE family protein [Candidatus Electryonea clarkiae]MDP8287745.1 sulfite exporter TauE/SafE family protein [Candidatus Electryonea clarkiae]